MSIKDYVYLVFFIFSTFIVFFVYVLVYLGQLLAQFKNTACLVVLPTLYAYVYVSVFFIHGQINDDDDDESM